MFGFFKKKKNGETAKPSKAANVSKYVPVFGSPDNFVKLYRQGDEHIVLGRNQGTNVGVTAIDPPGDTIYVVNDDADSILRQCVIPTVEQSKLSYIVYDPEGRYQEYLSAQMKARMYDIQVIDFNTENKSRIDLFEVVNITRNTYWTAIMLAGSIKCEAKEVKIAHDLFMTMMEYLLEKNGVVTIDTMTELFNKLMVYDKNTMLDMEQCAPARPSLLRLVNADAKCRASVYNKANTLFFKEMFGKLKNPNIFTVTSHKRKTVTFVRKVPAKYKNLITNMLFNLKVSSVVCGDGSASTLIIDTASDEWYNRKLLAHMTAEAGEVMDKSVATIHIRPTTNDLIVNDKQMLVYMHSDDAQTNGFVLDLLKAKNQLNQTEQMELAATIFNGKPLPQDALEAAPISLMEMVSLKDQIVIDMSMKAKAFRCNRLA